MISPFSPFNSRLPWNFTFRTTHTFLSSLVWLCLPTFVGVEGYCVSWSHTMTRSTHKHTHTLGMNSLHEE